MPLAIHFTVHSWVSEQLKKIRERDVIVAHIWIYLPCKQALQLGESREVTREAHAKRDASASGAGKERRVCNDLL